ARVDHGAELGGQLDAPGVPVELEAQRIVHVGGAGTREAGSAAHPAGIGREAVDVARREAGVRDRREARIERELERIAPEAAPDLRLADPGERGAAFVDLHQPPTGSNSGIQTSSRCSKITRTRIPIRTDSAGQFTMLVISRSPGCSSSSTLPMRAGWSGAGAKRFLAQAHPPPPSGRRPEARTPAPRSPPTRSRPRARLRPPYPWPYP